jgi:hypothetical protein
MSCHQALSWMPQNKKNVVTEILLFDFELFICVRWSNRGISLSH